jgi:hypothetical protein
VEIQPFIIITSKDILLLDTGLGFEKMVDFKYIETLLMQASIHQIYKSIINAFT